LRTVNGHVYNSYREACGALRLLEDDKEFINSIIEVSILGSGVSLRRMFAKLLMSNTMSDPLNVWEHVSDLLCDGILYHRRKMLNNPGIINVVYFIYNYLYYFIPHVFSF
jgi:hypothetical protein